MNPLPLLMLFLMSRQDPGRMSSMRMPSIRMPSRADIDYLMTGLRKTADTLENINRISGFVTDPGIKERAPELFKMLGAPSDNKVRNNAPDLSDLADSIGPVLKLLSGRSESGDDD